MSEEEINLIQKIMDSREESKAPEIKEIKLENKLVQFLRSDKRFRLVQIDSIENTYLYNLDDLSSIANENLLFRKNEISNAREILKKHTWSIWLQIRRRTHT